MTHSFLPFWARGLGGMAPKPASVAKQVTQAFLIKGIVYINCPLLHKFGGLKIRRNLHYVVVSVGQEVGRSIAGRLWL